MNDDYLTNKQSKIKAVMKKNRILRVNFAEPTNFSVTKFSEILEPLKYISKEYIASFPRANNKPLSGNMSKGNDPAMQHRAVGAIPFLSIERTCSCKSRK